MVFLWFSNDSNGFLYGEIKKRNRHLSILSKPHQGLGMASRLRMPCQTCQGCAEKLGTPGDNPIINSG